MNEAVSDNVEIQPRDGVKPPFCCLGNDIFDVFLPSMGANCFTILAYFERRVFSDPQLKHSVREVADTTELGVTTVLRSLEILQHLGLIKLKRFRGSKHSECQLLDSREAAERLGAEYHRKTLSFSLPPKIAQRLTLEVKALRHRQQGKRSQAARCKQEDSSGAVSQNLSKN
jgi:hypothetical protein